MTSDQQRTCPKGHDGPWTDIGRCITCRRLRDRAAKAAKTKARLIKEGQTSYCKNGHHLSGDNLVLSHRTSPTGTPFVQRICRTCSRRDKFGIPKSCTDKQRLEVSVAISRINHDLLTMADEFDLASGSELQFLRERRALLVAQKDKLSRMWRIEERE